jgi:glycosyltransferase involved in cell wall biosynthesis
LGRAFARGRPRTHAVKVLHVITTLATGGAELHLLNLARGLKSDGYDVSIAYLHDELVASRPLGPHFAQAGIKVHQLHGRHRLDLRPLLRLIRLIRHERPDVLHSHLARADLLAAAAGLRQQQLTVISTVHGIYRERWFGRAAQPWLRLAYKRADAVICVSYAVRTWLVNELGVDANRTHVVRHGVDASAFAPAKPQGPRQERQVIGAAGRLDPIKGFQHLLEAFALLAPGFPKLQLRIAGYDAGYGPALRALAQRAGVAKSVEFVGFQPDMPEFLRSLDIFVMPSLSEGLGQTALEAMATGLPVVASSVPALAEIIAPGQTGILVPPANPQALADGIRQLLASPAQAAAIGRRARDRVISSFTPAFMVQGVKDAYRAALGQSA